MKREGQPTRGHTWPCASSRRLGAVKVPRARELRDVLKLNDHIRARLRERIAVVSAGDNAAFLIAKVPGVTHPLPGSRRPVNHVSGA